MGMQSVVVINNDLLYELAKNANDTMAAIYAQISSGRSSTQLLAGPPYLEHHLQGINIPWIGYSDHGVGLLVRDCRARVIGETGNVHHLTKLEILEALAKERGYKLVRI